MNPMRSMLLWASRNKALARSVSEGGAFARAARRFVAGETEADAVAAARELNSRGMAVNLDFLGENTTSEEEARSATEGYVSLAGLIAREGLQASVSIKLTQLGLDLGTELALENTRRVVAGSAAHGVAVEIDMESSEYVDRTLDIYEAVQKEVGGVGIAVQAYLRRTPEDVERLIGLGAKVRVVKGAYKEPKSIAYQSRKAVREAFMGVVEQLLQPEARAKGVCAAIGSHDDVVLNHAAELVAREGIDRKHYEYQFLYGIRRDLHDRLATAGEPVRIYVPFGTHWYPYFMRRLAERPANLKFFLRALVGK